MQVSLTKHEPVPQQDGGIRTALWYLRVTAVTTPDSNGGSSAIFIYQIQPLPGLGDRFMAVASAAQLRDIPEGRDKVTDGSFYRTDQAEFMCRSVTELDEVWTTLQSDVKQLVRDWAKIGSTVAGDPVVITPGS